MEDLKQMCSEEQITQVIDYIEKSFNKENSSNKQFENIVNLSNYLKKYKIKIGPIEAEKILDMSPEINNAFYSLFLADILLRVNRYSNLSHLLQLYTARTGYELEKDLDDKLYSDSHKFKDIDLIKVYLNEIGEYKVLTKEEEIELLKQGRTGINKLIEHNLKLVVSIAKCYQGNGLPLGDLIQSGNEGLVIAGNKFDISKKCKFSTYAAYWIRQCITRLISDRSRTVRIPAHIHDNIIKIKKAINEYAMKNYGLEPTNEELSQILGISLNKIEIAKRCMENTVSLSTSVGNEEGDTELGELIEDESFSIEHIIEEIDLKKFIKIFENTKTISERDKLILMLRYGFYNDRIYTLEELGAMYNVTRERIRQIELTSLKKLKANNVIASFNLAYDVTQNSEVQKVKNKLSECNEEKISCKKLTIK